MTIAVVAAWLIFLRPQMLGGPASYVLVSGTSMLPTIEPGALVVVQRQASYEPGAIVAYRVPDGDPAAGHLVIHRIVGGSGDAGFVMRGDNVELTDLWRPTTADIVGQLWLIGPGVAPIIQFLMSPILVASAAAAFAAYHAVGALRPAVSLTPERDEPDRPDARSRGPSR